MKAISPCWSDALDIRVYYEDTDFSGSVYHASYLRFLERGRTEWLRRLGFGSLELSQSAGCTFNVRSLQIDFLIPARMDDLLTVETVLASLGGASIEFLQQISRGDQKLVTGTVLIAAVRGGRAVRLPDELRRALENVLRQ